MAGYSAVLARTLDSTTPLSIGSIEQPGSGMRRFSVEDLVFGCNGTPADASIRLQAQRSTTAATGTAFTPVLLDPADVASVILPKSNNTVEGTKTANAFALDISLNQRLTFRWVARPGRGIIVPATANNGLHFPTPTAPAVAASLTLHYEE